MHWREKAFSAVAKPNQENMKSCLYLIPAVLASLFVSCEQKEETTINPPAQHKEEKTTIVTPAPSNEKSTEKKTETETKVKPDGTTIEKKETSEEKK